VGSRSTIPTPKAPAAAELHFQLNNKRAHNLNRKNRKTGEPQNLKSTKHVISKNGRYLRIILKGFKFCGSPVLQIFQDLIAPQYTTVTAPSYRSCLPSQNSTTAK
jgi:hypothetical protein